MKRNFTKIAVLTVLTAVLLYFFGRSVEWSAVPAQIADVNVPLFLLAVLMAALHFLTRALRWHILVAREKIDVRFRNLLAANIVGFTVNAIFPGRLGEVAKPLYLARKEDLRASFAVGTVVVERIFDLATTCFLLGLFLLCRPLFASAWPVGADASERLTFWVTAGLVLAAVLVGASVLLYVFRERAVGVIGRALKPFPERARNT